MSQGQTHLHSAGGVRPPPPRRLDNRTWMVAPKRHVHVLTPRTCRCSRLENVFAGKLEHLSHAGVAGGWCPQGEGRCHVKTGRQTAGQPLAVREAHTLAWPRSLHRQLGVRASRLKGKVCLSEPPVGEPLWHWGTELTLPHTAVNRDGEERVPERPLAGCPKGGCDHYCNDGSCRQGAGPTPFTWRHPFY